MIKNHSHQWVWVACNIIVLEIAILIAGPFAQIALAETTATLQPAPGLNNGSDDGSAMAGKDAGFLVAYPFGRNNGDGWGDGGVQRDGGMHLFNSNCNTGVYPAFLQFSLANMPTANITKAEIHVYAKAHYNGCGWPFPAGAYQISLRKVTSSWNEMTVSRDTTPTYHSAVIDSKTFTAIGGGTNGCPATAYTEFEGWLVFDITNLYKAWANGSVPNHGVVFHLDTQFCQNGDVITLLSSDYADNPARRPKLVVKTTQPPVSKPAAPSDLKAVSASKDKVNLTWKDNASNEDGFKIYRKTGAEKKWKLLKITGPDVKSFSDTTATKNSTTNMYQYYVLAYNNAGNSVASVAALVPYQPTGLAVAKGATPTSMKLTWTDKSPNETGFEIYRKTGSCTSTDKWARVAVLGANKTAWTDTKCTADISYAYKIRAYKKTGTSNAAYGYSLFSACVSSGQNSGSGIEIDLERGGEASGSTGAKLEILEKSGIGTVEVIFGGQKATTDPVENGLAVSNEYTITMKNFKPGETAIPFKIFLPVNISSLPKPVDEYEFVAEWFNPDAGKWEKVDGMAVYDKTCACVSFYTNHLSKYRVVYMGIDLENRLKAFLYITDHFHITYFGPRNSQQTSDLIPKSTGWIGSGTAKDPQVPDYIEDLGKALEAAFTYHTKKIKTPDGNLLFQDPTHDNPSLPDGVIPVKVTRIPAKGDSRLGGPIRIDSQLKDWHEMKAVAAHELVHVLADQHYTGVGARMNRWYFEAMAELWATRAAGYTRRECVDYFSKRIDNYLKVSLDASDEDSYYAAGDFLAWLEEDVGAPVAAATVAINDSWDVNGLDKVLKTYNTNLGERFTEYVLESTVGEHDLRANQILQRIVLKDNALYKRQEFEQPMLSASFFRVISESNADGLLVVLENSNLSSRIVPFSYTQKNSVITRFEDTLEAKTPEAKPLVVKHFGKQTTPGVEYSVLRQVVINPNITRYSSVVDTYTYFYYLLVPPTLLTHTAGKVTWEYPNAYGGGASFIKGFDVWADGVKLTKTPVPFSKREYSDSKIKADSNIIIKVVDAYGNEWPEKDTSTQVRFSEPISKTHCIYRNAQTYECTNAIIINGTWTVTGTGISIEPAKSNQTTTYFNVSSGTSGVINITASASFDSNRREETDDSFRYVYRYHSLKFLGHDPNEYGTCPIITSLAISDNSMTVKYSIPKGWIGFMSVHPGFTSLMDITTYDKKNNNLVSSSTNRDGDSPFIHTIYFEVQ